MACINVFNYHHTLINLHQNKSLFYKAILKIKAALTKHYNIATGLWVNTTFSTNVADGFLFGEVWTEDFLSSDFFKKETVPLPQCRNN